MSPIGADGMGFWGKGQYGSVIPIAPLGAGPDSLENFVDDGVARQVSLCRGILKVVPDHVV